MANESTDGSIEQLGTGVTRQWLHERRLVIYSVTGGGIDITNAWADNVIQDMQAWVAHQPILSLQDLTQSGISVYGKARTEDIFKAVPSAIPTHIGVILGRGPLANFMRLLGEGLLRKYRRPDFTIEFFSSRAAGLAWLEQFLEPPLA